MTLPDSARELLESDALAHVVTINQDGSPQVSCVWVGLDGEEIVAAHLDREQRKLQNLRRDPRVCLTVEGSGANAVGMRDYLIIHGRARLEEGGAAELLQQLAHTYVGPNARFPPMDDPPPGVVSRITVERIGGHGPWAAKSSS
ncbi:MAG: PPOX class F420-dependent oxidoreductase [Solirubrobacteraceae bacterium]